MRSLIACFQNLIATDCGKKQEYSYHRQIDGSAQFSIPPILLTFGRMRQGDENFVKIQIFLQFALSSVKVLGYYCDFVSVCGFFLFCFFCLFVFLPLC